MDCHEICTDIHIPLPGPGVAFIWFCYGCVPATTLGLSHNRHFMWYVGQVKVGDVGHNWATCRLEEL